MRIESRIFILTGLVKPARRHGSGKWNLVCEAAGDQRAQVFILARRLERLKRTRRFDLIDGDRDEIIH